MAVLDVLLGVVPGAAVGGGEATRAPVRQRPALGAPGQRRVEARRQLHLQPPRLAALPAGQLEVVGGGGERIGNAGDQVAAAVAIAVHGDAGVGAGHELGMAEGAGPGPGQALGPQVAGLQQLQQREQFAAEERLATAFTGQGQQRHQQRALAGDAAVVALHAPHRDHRLRVDTVLLRDLREQVAMRGEHGATIVDALAVDQAGQVVPDRRGELGLGVEQRQHARVRLQTGGEAVEGRLGDTRLRRSRAQAGHAAGEGRIGRGRRRRGWGLRERARGRQQQDPGQTHHRNILADGRADIINNRRVCAPLTRRGRQARDRQRVPSVAWLADRAARCRGRDTHGVRAAAAFRSERQRANACPANERRCAGVRPVGATRDAQSSASR
ncbi:hypothetical protein NB723_003933 [Xanthomonas sacchari]|nr:hypothetical protein [Xanthomonas sacchari]